MKRKLLVLMAIRMAAVTTAWADDVIENNLKLYIDKMQGYTMYFNLNHTKKTAEVGGNSFYTRAAVIPEKVEYDYNNNGQIDSDEYYTVTSICNNAFGNASSGCSMPSISIPNTVTKIGTYAFFNCKELTSIVIPAGVTSIETATFRNCQKLSSITFKGNVTKIGSMAFEYCTSITSFTIPAGVTSIGSQAFNGCTKLSSITIPEGVTTIGSYAFQNCTGLTSITIPNSVTSIAEFAFYKCI